MTPSEKAKKLVDKFYVYVEADLTTLDATINAKKCAIILCDEMISQTDFDWRKQYWQQVRTEIEKL